MVGRNQGRARDDESLFEDVLSGEDGVRYAVGVDQPGAAGGEVGTNFGRVGLELLVFLQPIVKMEHEAIVVGTIRDGEVRGMGGFLSSVGEAMPNSTTAGSLGTAWTRMSRAP